MKKYAQKVGGVLAGAATLVASAVPAMAAVDLTGVTIDTTGPEDLTKMIIPALAVIWTIRKIIKTLNRS